MANLTGKELFALEDQLNFEHVCVSKYRAAAEEMLESALRERCNQHAAQHQKHFDTLLTYLK